MLSKTMNPPSSHRPQLTIWIDGDCTVCRRSEQWCTHRDRHRRLAFKNLHSPDGDELPASLDTMMQTVHVRLPDGSHSIGFDAWRLILLELDGWRWLARLAGLPGIKRLGSAIYSLVARNRHRVPFTHL